MPVWGTGGRWFESSHPDIIWRQEINLDAFFYIPAVIVSKSSTFVSQQDNTY